MNRRWVRLLMIGIVILIGVSAATTEDRVNWLLEELVVLLAIPLLLWFSERRGLTGILVVAAALQMMVITHGAQATYEHAWLGNRLGALLGMSRNPWDRIGHFFQGLVPALATVEVLRRHARLPRGPLVSFLAVSVAMCISATYEIIEMVLGLIGSEATRSFVDTNGDLLDPQWDMTMALVGALVAVIALQGWHERQLRRFLQDGPAQNAAIESRDSSVHNRT